MSNAIGAATTVIAVLVAASAASAQSETPASAPEGTALKSEIVAFGTARFGLPRSVSIVPSALKAKAGLVTTLPARNAKIQEGDVVLSVSGRPVFALRGDNPVYRDLTPGLSGDDVKQLESALARLGFDPGPVDGRYDEKTATAVAKWYTAAGWKPFGPTVAQRANIRSLQTALSTAVKAKLAATGAATAAEVAVEIAKATAAHAQKTAAADVAAKTTARDNAIANLAKATLAVEAARATADHLYKVASSNRSAVLADQKALTIAGHGTPLSVEAAKAKAEHANKAAKADIAAKFAARAQVMLDPRSLNSARAAAQAQLQLAEAAAANIELEGKIAVQTAERNAKLMAEKIEMAKAAVKAAKLEGSVAVRTASNARKAAERDVSLARQQLNLAQAAAKIRQSETQAAIQAAVDTLKVAEYELELASKSVSLATKDLEAAKIWVGVQVPADEIVFLPALPVQVEQATVLVGDPASGPVLAVKQGRMTIDTSVPVATARSLKKGMKVDIEVIDGSAPSRLATQGIIDAVAPRPGTNGVNPDHVYLSVSVVEGFATPPEGASFRLTIPTGRSDEKTSPDPSKQSRLSPEPLGASGTDPKVAESLK